MAISKNIYSKLGLGSSQNVPTCARCSGLLIKELFDPFDDTGLIHQWAWWCAQCGNIVDSLIFKHRCLREPFDSQYGELQTLEGCTEYDLESH